MDQALGNEPMGINSIGSEPAQSFTNWGKYSGNPVYPKQWNGIHASDPMVLYENETYRMWCVTQKEQMVKSFIEYATSKNGIDWTSQGIIMQPEQDWESQHLSDPFVMRDDAEQDSDKRYKMWYRGASPDNAGIGFATSEETCPFS